VKILPYIPPTQVAQAKQIDLLTYLQRNDPDELIHAGGGEYCTKSHDSLRISHGLWCWHSHGIGGRSALDYLIKVRGMNFLDAVEHLIGRSVQQPPVFLCPKTPVEKSRHLLLPPIAPNHERVLTYLQSRGIDREVLDFCVATGRLYESADYHNAVFVGMNCDNQPHYAALRGTNSSFKGEASGSDKRYSFSLPAQNAEQLHLFESAIDALSYATLLTMHGRDWRQTHLLSLAGVFAPAKKPNKRLPVSLARYLVDYPKIQRIDLHLDNDLAGQAAAENIMALLGETLDVRNRSPPNGKDVNEYLQLRLELLADRRGSREER
jgi:hypothetical protein